MSIAFYAKSTMASTTLDVALVKTAWGFSAIAMQQERLVRVFLPWATQCDLWGDIEKTFSGFERNDEGGLGFQQHLQDYFEGNFSRPKGTIDLSGKTDFGQSVLKACYAISPGITLTYGQLASKAGSPRAARAVGGVMARNPVPIIIPCHRVLGSDGALTGYSGSGGVAMKQRLLDHEQQAFA